MLRFNLTKLDEKIAKMQEVRRMVEADPEMAKLLVDCLSEEDEAGEIEEESERPIVQHRPRVPIFRSRRNAPTTRNGLHQTVAETARSFGERPFDVNVIYNQMRKDGFEFRSKRPSVSVGIELRKLHGKNKLELLRQGSGSTASVFRNRGEA